MLYILIKTSLPAYTFYLVDEVSVTYLHHWRLNFVDPVARTLLASFVGRRNCGLSVTVVDNGAGVQLLLLLLLTSVVFVSLLFDDRLFDPRKIARHATSRRCVMHIKGMIHLAEIEIDLTRFCDPIGRYLYLANQT
jgi:hypothetical protein